MPLRVRVDASVRTPRGAPLGRRETFALLRRAARAALAAEGVRDAELAITLLDDPGVAALNERYLAHEGPTDVISFALHGATQPPLGDIYIGWQQAIRQAVALGIPPVEELARLAIHGTLHILGYDHPAGNGREESEMWHRQETILHEVVGR